MQKLESYIKKIHNDFPDFYISSIKEIGEGWDSRAFRINRNYIFRFPKRENVKSQLKIETEVLPKIRPFLNLEIPKFEFISPKLNFVGYKSIPGKPLTNRIFQRLEKKYQKSIQHTLANFLSQLHSIHLSELKNFGLEEMNLKEEYQDNFDKTQKLIYPHISKNKREIITQLFTDYLSNPKNFNYVPKLIHNDFSKDHILLDTANKHLTGIIDFGDIALGDPDYDLMFLLDEFGEIFLSGIIKNYKLVDRKKLIKKLYFFSLANKLQIILASIRDDNEEDLREAYKVLNKWFKKFTSKK